jgi:Fe-S oxidoreductase
MPGLYNAIVGSAPGRAALRSLGLVALPAMSGLPLGRELAARGVSLATPEALRLLAEPERARSVVVVQDAFTSAFETGLLLDLLDLLTVLGFRPWLAPFRPNGKPLHVHGFLGRFARVAANMAGMLRALADAGVPLVGLDPSMTLTYRSEYAEALPGETLPRVLLIQEWLASRPDVLPHARERAALRLLPHCTERTTAASSLRDWVAVFGRCGLDLEVLRAGCCGMAGTYGHEAEHRSTSEIIYAQSWARHVRTPAGEGAPLADGYSCRSQAKLIDGVLLRHPVQELLARLKN